MGKKTKLLKDIPTFLRTSLELFEQGRPAAWKHENLLKRSLRLAKYARRLTLARYQELGLARDRDYKDRQRIDALEQQVGRLQEVASAAAWVIADHMSGSYDAVVFVDGQNKHINSEQHGDGMCRVLALQLAKLKPEDKIGIEGFVDCDFDRAHRLLQRNLPEDIKR